MKRVVGLLVVGLAFGACSGSVFSLEEGDCFDDEDEFTEEVSDVPVVDCSEPHDNEVYAVIQMTDSDFPGFDATADHADSVCLPDFESFVGADYETSELEFGWLIPTTESWATGDRSIVCFLYRLDLAPMTGTMEGSGI